MLFRSELLEPGTSRGALLGAADDEPEATALFREDELASRTRLANVSSIVRVYAAPRGWGLEGRRGRRPGMRVVQEVGR